jgi:hypothetical protein
MLVKDLCREPAQRTMTTAQPYASTHVLAAVLLDST